MKKEKDNIMRLLDKTSKLNFGKKYNKLQDNERSIVVKALTDYAKTISPSLKIKYKFEESDKND